MILDINCSDFIFITPNEYRKDFIKYFRTNLECNFKLYDKEELLREYYGKYDINALIFVMNKNNISYENALMLLNNISFSTSNSINEKITSLISLKNELNEKGLLIKNEYLVQEFKNKKVYIFGYGKEDIELRIVLQNLKVDFTFLDFVNGKFIPKIYEFATINDEVFFVFNQICDLLKSGVQQKNIVLISDDSYSVAINKMCHQFNLPNLMAIKINYAHKPKILNIIKQIEELGISDFLNKNIENNDEIINEIKDIIENYQLSNILNEKRQIEVLKSLLNSMILVEDSVSFFQTSNSLGISNDENFYFLLGFNQTNYPIIKKDDDYLTNQEKSAVNRLTSFEENNTAKKKIIFEISNTKHLVASYCLVKNNEMQYVSSLVNEMGYEIHKNAYSKIVYSKDEANKTLAKFEDLKRKYDFDSDLRHSYLRILDIPYMTYNHKFKKINNYHSQKDQRKYSYSSIKDYFICPFKYYLTHILCIDDFEDTFNTKIGNVFHKILENVYQDDFDYEKEYNEAIKQYEFSKRELVLLERMKKEFVYFIDLFKERKTQMNLKYALKERTYEKNLSQDVIVKGKIDSVIVTTDGEKDYYSIIDYKTGHESFNKEEVPYGFSMQLPTYALLLKDNVDFNDKQLIGYYIQPICNNDIKIPQDFKKEFIKNNYKLTGGFIIDLEKVRTFIKDFSHIKNLKEHIEQGKKGVNTKEEFDEIIKVTENNFLSADKKIQDGEFAIKPVKIKGKSKCEYCPFEDICNKEYDDYNEINLQGDE